MDDNPEFLIVNIQRFGIEGLRQKVEETRVALI